MIIETDEEHRLALLGLDWLMEFARTDDQGKAIEALSLAIDVYERAHYPIADPTPAEAAAFRLAEGGPICKEKGHVRSLAGEGHFCLRCGIVLPDDEP